MGWPQLKIKRVVKPPTGQIPLPLASTVLNTAVFVHGNWRLEHLAASKADPRMEKVIRVFENNRPVAYVTRWASKRISCTGHEQDCRTDSKWCYHRDLCRAVLFITPEEVKDHVHHHRNAVAVPHDSRNATLPDHPARQDEAGPSASSTPEAAKRVLRFRGKADSGRPDESRDASERGAPRIRFLK